MNNTITLVAVEQEQKITALHAFNMYQLTDYAWYMEHKDKGKITAFRTEIPTLITEVTKSSQPYKYIYRNTEAVKLYVWIRCVELKKNFKTIAEAARSLNIKENRIASAIKYNTMIDGLHFTKRCSFRR